MFPNLIPWNKIFMLIHWLGLLVTWEAQIKAETGRRGQGDEPGLAAVHLDRKERG